MTKKELQTYLQVNGYIIGSLAKRDYVYEVLADRIKAEYPYYWYLYCDVDIKQTSEDELLKQGIENIRKGFKKKFNDTKRRIIREKYNITR